MASKSKRRRKVLGASCILAALIIAGSSFAWFTSKDEVTNRLSASAEYEMAIAEQFQPPETWVPGQEIDKDVAVVNTGNVDAFTRVWLNGSMRVLNQYRGGASNNAANANADWVSDTDVASTISALTTTTDESLLRMNLTKFDDTNNVYFKTLSKTQTLNANATASGNNGGYAGTDSNLFNEIQAMQTGKLAYAPANAEYSYVLKEDSLLDIYYGATAGNHEKVVVPAGTLVKVVASAPAADHNATANTSTGLNVYTGDETITSTSGSPKTYNKTVYVPASTTSSFAPKNIEFESFTPVTNGLYLFLRTEDGVAGANPEFSGYVKNDSDYFALNTNTLRTNKSDNTVAGIVKKTGGTEVANYGKPILVNETTDGVITSVVPSAFLELYNASYTSVPTANLKWVYNDSNKKIYAFYDKNGDDKFTTDDDIAVEISLASANIGTSNAQQWTPLGAGTGAATNYTVDTTATNAFSGVDASKLTFYYNDDVESGDTTAILVDQVKLIEQVTNKAYLAFDFDLKVNMESVQVTMDENGNEMNTAIASGWVATKDSSNNDVNTGATTVTQTPSTASGEITKMAWS